MGVITRFAPSPTGYLHIGNIRTAIVNWLFTRKNNGKFMLRMDDTDLQRSKQEYADAIIRDLKWLGLDWDIFAKQSDRLDRYNEVKQQLIKDGRLYACYETAEEIEIKRKMQLSRGLPPIYDRAALKLTSEQISNFEKEGRKPHYRFKMLENDIKWNDLVRGEVKFNGAHISDPIVIREDSSMTYILCSVIDDIDYNITNIIRGEDHISNTAIQIQIFEALNAMIPTFAHTSHIVSKEGKISKRLGGFDIASLREDTMEPMTICSFFSKIGTSDPVEVRKSLSELVNDFDISKFSRSAANYEQQELVDLNHKLVSQLSFNDVKDKLISLGMDKVNELFWDAIKGNINLLKDSREWYDICFNKVKPLIENPELINIAIQTLPSEPWNLETWPSWIKEIQQKTDLKGKNLFMPLRKALTGLKHGPELKMLLVLIGSDKALGRLKGNEA
ncbi:MAG: glutamate--tRNA ligase [Sphingobacteriia bacterium]|nr:glutamate--tRNA ligase [Sphingobacteriia bacterium]